MISLKFNSCLENHSVKAVIEPYLNDRGWETTVHLIKNPDPLIPNYLLAVRERATGNTKKELMRKSGLAYWNHAIYFYLTDKEGEMFKNACNDNDKVKCIKGFEDFYSRLVRKAYSVKPFEPSLIYAVAVYGGYGDDTLKGYVTAPCIGFGGRQLLKYYDIWSWTVC